MHLPAGPWKAVAADPPWDMGMVPRRRKKSSSWWAASPYRTMSVEMIRALDVARIMAPDSWLFVWAPSRLVATAWEVARAWGAKPVGVRVWHKTDGGPQMPGQWRHDAEFVVVGRYGQAKWLDTRGFPAVFAAPRPRRTGPCRCEVTGIRRCSSCPPRFEHSAKPACFYSDLARRCEGPRLDMFARRRHPGWEPWGDEAPP